MLLDGGKEISWDIIKEVKFTGSGNGDTVPAMLTPGEFVMSKGAVNQIGVDNLKEMNAAGGGTNVPKMMKFAGGGSVPDIGIPTKRKGKVTIIKSGGNKSSSPNYGSSGSGVQTLLVFHLLILII